MFTGNELPSFDLKRMVKNYRNPNGDIRWCRKLKFGSHKEGHPALLIRDYLDKKLVLPCTSADDKRFFLLNDVRVFWYWLRKKNTFASHLPELVPLDSFGTRDGYLTSRGKSEFRAWVFERL